MLIGKNQGAQVELASHAHLKDLLVGVTCVLHTLYYPVTTCANHARAQALDVSFFCSSIRSTVARDKNCLAHTPWHLQAIIQGSPDPDAREIGKDLFKSLAANEASRNAMAEVMRSTVNAS